jgi:hypothetical protein
MYKNTEFYQHRPQNLWLSFTLKFVGLVGSAAVAATIGVHMIHRYGAPPANAPVAQQVRYFAQGLGKVGQNSHWIMEASENTAQWQKAKAYCQQKSAEQDGVGHVQGCGTINELANSGY